MGLLRFATTCVAGVALLLGPPESPKESESSEYPRPDVRPVVEVMHFADYDHDGDATEFYLQTESLPCGKSTGIVVGVSKSEPRLHVFGTSSTPSQPLYLQRQEWESLRDASGPIEVLDWACRDHASDTQTTVQLRWTAVGIEGTRRTFECTDSGNAGKLIDEDPL